MSYESRRVVILDCFGISKGFQDGIGLKQLLLQLPLMDTKTQNNTKYKDNFLFVHQLNHCLGVAEIFSSFLFYF